MGRCAAYLLAGTVAPRHPPGKRLGGNHDTLERAVHYERSATELADDLEVSKALKNIVDVKSASGEWYTITIPKNERALKADPNEAAWRLSHQAAHESVLSNPCLV